MTSGQYDVTRGLDALRAAVLQCLAVPAPALAGAGRLFSEGLDEQTGVRPDSGPAGSAGPAGPAARPSGPSGTSGPFGDGDQAVSNEADEETRSRLIGLVELARKGDKDAFGMLYDHYHVQVFRFLYYRTRSTTLAEDLTSETFFRALRSMNNFRWQGKDFGAWLMTIARNLTMDHFKAGRTRLEQTTEDMSRHDDTTESPESEVLASLTNELLMEALRQLPAEQQDCLVMRFLQGLSIAETALALDRSEGAVKQLQLRGVRNLAKLMPEGIRE